MSRQALMNANLAGKRIVRKRAGSRAPGGSRPRPSSSMPRKTTCRPPPGARMKCPESSRRTFRRTSRPRTTRQRAATITGASLPLATRRSSYGGILSSDVWNFPASARWRVRSHADGFAAGRTEKFWPVLEVHGVVVVPAATPDKALGLEGVDDGLGKTVAPAQRPALLPAPVVGIGL